MGGRYLRKRWPGVSNMRHRSPPHTLHLGIWPLSELISWRIKANHRDPMACGCLRRTLPRPSLPPGMRLTDTGHCAGHLDRHTPHLPCHAAQFDEVIWQNEQDLTIHLMAMQHFAYTMCYITTATFKHVDIIIIHTIISPFSPDHYGDTICKLASCSAMEWIKST